jgi:TRAP transporter 4TM/12TM fusion protein
MAEVGTEIRAEVGRYESMPKPLKVLFLIFTTIGIGLFIYYMLGFSFRGFIFRSVEYYYLLYALYASSIFLILPARKKDKNRVPWYDIVFATLSLGIFLYFFSNAWRISEIGWVPPPSTLALALASIFCLLALESGRRMGGLPFFIVCLIAASYPLFADHMPGVFYGVSFSFDHMVGFYAFGGDAVLGLPAQIMGEILIGFLIFAGMLIASGAGDFFLKLALCLLGRFRGGPAKVAVLASGLFGSLSGSPVSNVVATGSVTIPAMKRMGYPAHYAGAIEGCASTGGTIMPPVMGTIAFIMAIMTGIDYGTIIVAAFIPAFLYYFGLMIQVDAYAARVGLKGLPQEELPSLKETLKRGWVFIVVLVFLIWGFVYMRWSAVTPIYASGLMFILSFASKETMMTPRRIVKVITMIGNLITQTMAIILPLCFIIGGLVVTGMISAFTAEMVALGGGNVFTLLLMGVVACYLLGMAGLGGIAYIFLAVTLAPAIIKIAELNVVAVHLFIIYYAIMASITPPVAVTTFVAAAVAGSPPLKTTVTAMRLGIVLYFIPFFFVFKPALVLQGSGLETLYLFALCLLGILILAGGLEGYLVKVGRLTVWQRPLLVAAGFLIAFPGWITTLIGAALAALVIAIILIRKRTTMPKQTTIGY